MRIVSRVPVVLLGASMLCFVLGCSKTAENSEGSAQPDLPVKIVVRDSVVGEGYVVQFHNEANQRFVLTVCIENKAGKDRTERTLPIGPSEMQELGWVQGWKFASGDRITVKHDKYKSSTATVP